MAVEKNLMKKDITGMPEYRLWYKPFDEEKRIAFMVSEDLIVNDKRVNGQSPMKLRTLAV